MYLENDCWQKTERTYPLQLHFWGVELDYNATMLQKSLSCSDIPQKANIWLSNSISNGHFTLLSVTV